MAVRWRRLHRRANGDGDQRERTARNPFTKRALRPYNQALKHRLEDASWRGVLYSHYGLRLIVFRTATLLMRRLLVWCERLSCSSELVVVMYIVRVVEELWRAAVESLATDHEARAHRCGYVREMRWPGVRQAGAGGP